jgi:hypothetical protein
MAAMLAFAANSLLSRAALAAGYIAATDFTTVRLAGGVAVLGILSLVRRTVLPAARLVWGSAVTLFAYAIDFSLVYVRVPTGVAAAGRMGGIGSIDHRRRHSHRAGSCATRSYRCAASARRWRGVGHVLVARATEWRRAGRHPIGGTARRRTRQSRGRAVGPRLRSRSPPVLAMSLGIQRSAGSPRRALRSSSSASHR